MYFDERYTGKERLRTAAAAEVLPRDRILAERLIAIPGARRAFDRLLYFVERAVPSDPRIDSLVAQIAPDVLLVSPLVLFNSPQVDYIKTARALKIPSALCVASWDNLSNKGQMRETPDRVTVWNSSQLEEAVALHGYPRDRVVVTGAQTFDQWFEFRASRSKEAFLSERGLKSGSPLLLYLCSSTSIAPQEVNFVREWQEALRNSADPKVARAAILVRPHPYNRQPWQRLDSMRLANFAVWPRDATGLYHPQWQHDYFDSLYHADAVIGLNTSGMLEAGLIGKPVLTVLSNDIPQTLHGTQDTLHFDYLLNVNGGLLHVAPSWQEHSRHLAMAIDGNPAMAERSRRFTEAFIRPRGIDKPATSILVDAIRSLPAVKPRASSLERVLCDLILRPVLEILLLMRKAAKLRRMDVLRKANSFPRLVRLKAAGKTYRFLCPTNSDVRRVNRLFTKEPGTIQWLSQILRPDDIFFDIGANVGTYSIFAAREMGLHGYVYAFEPHLANAASLLQNIEANDLLDKIHVISVPLADQDGFGPFHYHSIESSRSQSQFGEPVIDGKTFRPAVTELKYGTRLDALLDTGIIPAPTIIKIDVDGLEAEILDGMKSLLASTKAPRSIQVELSKDNADEVISQMNAAGYELVSRHWTQSRQGAIDEGAEPLTVFPHNVIFAKAAARVERQLADRPLVQAN